MKEKETARMAKISLIRTETANATTAELQENAKNQETAAQKDRVAGADAGKAMGRATAAEMGISTGMAAQTRAAHLALNRKNSQCSTQSQNMLLSQAYFDFCCLRKND
jgi:hypothetical protein